MFLHWAIFASTETVALTIGTSTSDQREGLINKMAATNLAKIDHANIPLAKRVRNTVGFLMGYHLILELFATQVSTMTYDEFDQTFTPSLTLSLQRKKQFQSNLGYFLPHAMKTLLENGQLSLKELAEKAVLIDEKQVAEITKIQAELWAKKERGI